MIFMLLFLILVGVICWIGTDIFLYKYIDEILMLDKEEIE